MAETNFGIMELLQKLVKERGKGVSDKEKGVMDKATGKGYESFIDKNRFDPNTGAVSDREMQTLDPLANTTPYSNATTPALNKMRSYSGVISGGGNPANWGGSDNRFGQQYNWGEPDAHGINNPFTSSYRGAMSDNELQNFKIGASYVDDSALTGYVANNIPNLTRLGVGNIDLNVPPREIRNQIDAMTARPFGAMSGREYEFMEDGQSVGYNFTGDGVSERALANLRRREGIQPNLGGGSDRERSMMQGMTQGAVSDVDTSFAQALSGLTPREQAEIISVTQGYTDEQVDNFKRQYLRGKVSPYELGAQKNLGF
jgi:hypothetical protein